MSPPHERRRSRRGPAHLGALLAQLAQGSGDGRLRQASVGAALADALGPHLARRLTSVSLDGDACLVGMVDAASAGEVTRHAGLILGRLRGRLGTLAPARLVVTASGAMGPRSRQPRGPAEPPPREVPPRPDAPESAAGNALGAATEAALAAIEDPDERERLARWIRRARARPG